eukprot:scaffold62177_cov53-Attheya_sp.AAC.2
MVNMNTGNEPDSSNALYESIVPRSRWNDEISDLRRRLSVTFKMYQKSLGKIQHLNQDKERLERKLKAFEESYDSIVERYIKAIEIIEDAKREDDSNREETHEPIDCLGVMSLIIPDAWVDFLSAVVKDLESEKCVLNAD